MSGSFRLAADAPHGFSGTLLDRGKPLRFRLNGAEITGFAGDTVLSALLAHGVLLLGAEDNSSIALEPSSAPAVASRSAPDPALALPIHRLPATDGADLVTVAPRRDPLPLDGIGGWVRRRRLGLRRLLNLRLGGATGAPAWLTGAPEIELATDIVVIGAGPAGLAAAGFAALSGKRVLVLERAAEAGGALPYFGAVESEARPAEQIARLVEGLQPKPQGRGRTESRSEARAEILFGTEAFRLLPGRVLAHQIMVENGVARGRVVAIDAPAIVLATGSFERLPVFAGNRLPGVIGSLDGFNLVRRHGVWPGRRTLVTTPHSHAYRLGLYLNDAGVTVSRIVDSRLAPNSRFIDFCKASGLTFSSGMLPAEVQALQAGELQSLSVGFAGTAATPAAAARYDTDTLVAAGTFQPELGLWLGAGGRIAWSAESRQFLPQGSVPGVMVAGAASGWRSTAAALRSGEAAILQLLGKPAPPIDDPVIPVLYETPDGGNPVGPERMSGRATAYLDRGTAYVPRSIANSDPRNTARKPAPLSLGSIAAAVELGALAPLAAADIARERTALGPDLGDTGWKPDPGPLPTGVPAYLSGRFGPAPRSARLSATDGRAFEPGALLFAGSGVVDAREAIGVVYRAVAPGETGGIALIADPAPSPEALIFVRENGGLYTARVASSEALPVS